MESRIMQVFYGNDCLPYKDKERSVHYPVVGNSFTGASETTKIRFYVKDIGGVENVTWVAVVKLPNGKIGFKVLSTIGNDLEVGERYIEFSLNSFYTQYNGDLAIALKGYQGNIQVEEDEETGIYEIVGTPTIQATGVIKLSVNYSTQLPVTQGFSPDELVQLMALIAEKLNIASGIVILLNDEEDISGYTNGQLFYVVSRNQFMQLVENELQEKELKVYDLVPGQQATMSIIANTLTNVNGRVLSAYESAIIVVNDYQCYKITRGGENLTEEYASRYMEFMTGSKYLPKYDYEHPKNTYLITPSGLILKPQYDDTNGLLLYPMTNLATRDYVDNDILEITDTATPLTYEQRQKILTNNVRIKYNNFYYEKVNHLGHNVRFECADLVFLTNADGSTTISKLFIVIRDDTGSIVANTRELVTYSKSQADQYFANSVQMSVDSNYNLKVKLIDKNGNQLAEDSVDLPLESIVQSAQYYETYTYQGTTYEDVIVITLATTDIPTIIPVGDLVSGLVSESTFNSGMATKVDKTNSAMKLYGTNGSGNQDTINYGSGTNGNYIVQRDSTGQMFVPETPTRDLHATSKVYVDAFAKDIELSLDQSTYVLTAILKNANGENIVTRTIDLPLETMVVSGSYDNVNQAIILTLKNGQTISIPVGDLVSGLVSTDYLQTNYYNKTQIDEMVAGFVFADVDDSLSSVSTNPVENRVITQALEEKANVNGNYPTMTVGFADNLTPYDESAGDDQDEPFSFQATGTGNGTQPDFSTGSGALMKEKQGNTVVVNQKCSVYTGSWTTSDNNDLLLHNSSSTFIANHKYLFMVEQSVELISDVRNTFLIDNNPLTNYGTKVSGNLSLYTFENQNLEKGLKVCIFSCSSNVTGVIKYWVHTPSADVTMKNFAVIDLTQWFNGDIPQDILDNPRNFFRYYQGSLAYNEGTLVNADGRYIKCIGMNQWDGTNDVKAIPNATYYINGSATLTYKDREGNTISSESKTNQTFVTPSNCLSIGVSGSGDISINLYYEDEPRCLTYEPYEELTNNDTGTETLRSAGSIADIKLPSGEIKRNVGYVDLATLSWTAVDLTGAGWTCPSLASLVKAPSGNSVVANIISANYFAISINGLYSQTNGIAFNSGGGLYVKNGSDSITPTGYLFYELAEPTTEQGTPYSENLAIDDFGSMDFGGTNGVPQGALIFYPVDYKAFVDTLYKYSDGTPSDLAKNSELNAKFESYLKSLSGYDASATQLLKNVEGTLTWVTEGDNL